LFTVRRSQAEVFAHPDRKRAATSAGGVVAACCDYVEACATRAYGQHALEQQEILEIGAGAGLICEELARRGAVMVGLERSPEALALARRRAQESGLGHLIYYLEGQAAALPFAEGAFSMIVCLQTSAWVVDLRAAVAEIARVLAPGGLFIFATPDATLLARLLLLWPGRRSAVSAARAIIRPRELAQLLSAHGLEPAELRRWRSAGPLPPWSAARSERLRAPAYVGYALRREQAAGEA
jgi:2-polyprenyl-6-hydroxyphenyl methylase/3-demethylubiquinone-9 3-methyltransferase